MTPRQMNLGLEEGMPRERRPQESRRERRMRTVRQVEFTPFPRVGTDPRTGVGFTRDVSASGLSIGVEQPLPVGSLLRVIVQQVDGRADFDVVARVAWCREAEGDEPGTPRAWMGLCRIAEVKHGMARIPREAQPVRKAS